MTSTEIAITSRVQLNSSLVRRHQRDVWRYLRFLGCSRSQAEDLAQEVFLRLLRRPPEDRGDRALGRWLRTTAKNLFRNTGRAPRRGVVLDAERLEELWARTVRDDSDEYLEALRQCLAALPEQGRRAVILRYVDGDSRTAVAAALGTSEEGIKSTLRRARARLHRCIDRRMRTQP